MKVLLASSEALPYSKTGGLADMVGSLAKALAGTGVQVVLVTPLYRGVADSVPDLTAFRSGIPLRLGDRTVEAAFWRSSPQEGVEVFFVDQASFYDRPALYQEHGEGYPDNAERFIFFSHCVVWAAEQFAADADVVHVHDWQAALVPLMLHHRGRERRRGAQLRTCLTIHNLAYQGHFSWREYTLTNLPWDYYRPEAVEYWGGMNCLKAGIVFADQITTVSPRYAGEICTPEFGCGLDGVLRERSGSLVGILNGVDYREWTTQGNPHLRNAYDVRQLGGKSAEKLLLQQAFGLDVSASTPLFGNISRLVDQKGSDLILASLEEMLPSGLHYVQLGSGVPWMEQAFLDLQRRYPTQVAVQIGYDNALAHRIEAACDFYLMPSRFEPCGLNQLYSLRYGTIPVVRATGGLADSVIDATEEVEKANGIKFDEGTPRALSQAIRKALTLYRHEEAFAHYRRNGMELDFSWERTVTEYLKVYRKLTRG
jgi:starch synthase